MHDQELHDPATFAVESMMMLRSRFCSLSSLEAPRELAAYNRARAAYLRSLPDGEPVASHPFHTMDEATYEAVGAAFEAGLAAGAHWEGLRRSLVPDVTTCPRCHGIGSEAMRQGSMAGSEAPCPECDGAGTVGISEGDA